MSDLTSFLEALKGLSPLLGILAVLLVAWFLWLKHLEASASLKAEKTDKAKATAEIAAMNAKVETLSNKTVALSTTVKNISAENGHMLATVELHDQKAEQRFTKQIDVLVQIHEQLVRLNASHATVINPDNAKRIIQYQWSWCKEETSRLIVNSIRNNSFRNREDIVARKVYDFWRKAAQGSLDSLLRLEGLQYPYKHLYSSHLAIIWSLVWSWAVPIYHSVHTDDGFEFRLLDLESRVKALFDQVLTLHYSLVEDIDHGLFYTEAKDQKDVSVVNDLQAPHDMGTQLRMYKSGSTDRLQPTPELRALLAKAIAADRIQPESASSSSGFRTKSSIIDVTGQG